MKPIVAPAQAIEWLEAQSAEINQFRNANTRDSSFKQWRQNTLTVIQRVWPGFGPRVQRFRRVPFTPPSSLADSRQVRDAFERGCAEAQALLRSWIVEIQRHGIVLEEGEPVAAAGGEIEESTPTLDLRGEAPATEPPPVDISEHGVPSIDLSPDAIARANLAETPAPTPVQPPPFDTPLQSAPAASTAKPAPAPAAPTAKPVPASRRPAKPTVESSIADAFAAITKEPKTASSPARTGKKEVRKAKLKDMLGFGDFGEPVADSATPDASPFDAPAPTAFDATPAAAAFDATPAMDEIPMLADLEARPSPFLPPSPPQPMPASPAPDAHEIAAAFDVHVPAFSPVQMPDTGFDLSEIPVAAPPPVTPIEPRPPVTLAPPPPPAPSVIPLHRVMPAPPVRDTSLELESVAPRDDDDLAFGDPTGELEITMLDDLPPVADRDEQLDITAAAAIALIATEIDRLGVPQAEREQVQTDLLALAMTIERGELDWFELQRAIANVMKYPRLGRRAVPALVPLLERTA